MCNLSCSLFTNTAMGVRLIASDAATPQIRKRDCCTSIGCARTKTSSQASHPNHCGRPSFERRCAASEVQATQALSSRGARSLTPCLLCALLVTMRYGVPRTKLDAASAGVLVYSRPAQRLPCARRVVAQAAVLTREATRVAPATNITPDVTSHEPENGVAAPAKQPAQRRLTEAEPPLHAQAEEADSGNEVGGQDATEPAAADAPKAKKRRARRIGDPDPEQPEEASAGDGGEPDPATEGAGKKGKATKSSKAKSSIAKKKKKKKKKVPKAAKQLRKWNKQDAPPGAFVATEPAPARARGGTADAQRAPMPVIAPVDAQPARGTLRGTMRCALLLVVLLTRHTSRMIWRLPWSLHLA
jgi:hypothetical protein